MRKLLIVGLAMFFLLSCGPNNEEREGDALLSKLLSNFTFETYSTQVSVRKAYSETVQTLDEMRMFSKINGGRRKFLMQVKANLKHKAQGFLVEAEDNQVVSAYRWSTGQAEPLAIASEQITKGSDQQSKVEITVAGLSLLDIQMLQGIIPRKKVRRMGVVEIDSKSCYELEIQYVAGYPYDRVQIFALQEEMLPALVKAYNDKGKLIKEIVFDKYEQVSGKPTVKVLIVKDHIYGYSSTLEFRNTVIADSIDDTVFSLENLKKEWLTETQSNTKSIAGQLK